MDSIKKNRSSFQIKRSAASLGLAESEGGVGGPRQMRRISFSGKKSVREFCGEEEPQTWNNSYEVSDHGNASGPESSTGIGAFISRSAAISSTDESNDLRYAADKENIQWNSTTASTTVGKALVPRCVKTIATVDNENNIEVSLLGNEKDRTRHLRSKAPHFPWSGSDSEHPSITFSMYEHDYHVLQTNVLSYSEKTEDYLRELHGDDCVAIHGSFHKDSSKTVICNEEMVESMNSNYNVGERSTASQTICMNEQIEAEDENCRKERRLTLRAVEEMQVSLLTANGQRNEKFTQNNDTMSIITVMEVKSPLHDVLRERLEAESMNLVQMTESSNNSLKAPRMNADELGKGKNQEQISMSISCMDGNNIAGGDESRVTAVVEMDVEPQEHLVLHKPELKLIVEGKPGVKPATKKVIVVRKMSPSPISVEQSDLIKGRSDQHKVTASFAVKEEQGTMGAVFGDRNLNISLINAEDIFVTPDYSSPLFPPEFVSSNKKLNFRQLNDEIERGEIQIYSELSAKEPYVRRKSVGKQLFAMPKNDNFSKHAKQGEAIQQSEDDMRVSLYGNSSIEARSVLRLSEACNMFDNTSFLIKEKLGDETASRNSSKYSSSNRRETIHFNDDVDVTMECGEKIIEDDREPECCNEGDAEEGNSILGTFACAPKNQWTPTDHKRSADSRRITILEVEDINFNDTNATIHVTSHANVSDSKEMDCETRNTTRRGVAESRIGHSSIDLSLRNANKEMNDEKKPSESNIELNVRKAEEVSRSRRTIIFTGENTIPLDESAQFPQANEKAEFQAKSIHEGSRSFEEEGLKDEYNMSVKPLNAAKIVLMRQNALQDMEDSLTQKLNETRATTFGDSKEKPERTSRHEASMDISPVVVNDQQEYIRRLCEGTPHRSVIEFECLEHEAEQEQQRYEETETVKEERHHNSLEMSIICCETEKKNSLKSTSHDPISIEMDVSGLQPLENDNASNAGFGSPIVSALIRKRLTTNFTPNLPVSKKRQTLMFNNCGVEESIVYIGDQVKEKAVNELLLAATKHEARAVPQKNDNEPGSICNINRMVTSNFSMGEELKVNNITASKNSLTIENLSSPTATSMANVKGDAFDLSNTSVSRIPVCINSSEKNCSIKCGLTSKWGEFDINHSLETIQIPRKATAFIQQQEQSIKLPASGNDTAVNRTINESGKQQSVFCMFEANPITISDVSAHYLAQQTYQKINQDETDAQEDDLCVLHENTAMKFLPDFEKDYFSDIDKTRLTLVESLISESAEDRVDIEDDTVHDEWGCDEVNDSNCLQKAVQNRENKSMCRKCRNFQEILVEENMTSIGETLVLPTLPSLPCPGLKRLLHLRQRPAVADVHEYWRRKSLERSLSPENLGTQLIKMEEKNEDQPADDFNITALMTDIQRVESQVKEVDLADCSFRKHLTFVQRLDEMLTEKSPRWIFDYQMQHRGIFIFSHKLLITFAIVMIYEETNLIGDSIRILNIEVQNSRVAKKNWKPIDFFMDCQFRLDLPMDLKSACMSSDEHGIMKILQDIDEVCMDVVLSGYCLWRLVCSEQASLVRDNGRTIVRKIVREVVTGGAYQQVEKTEYKVELANLKTMSFKDILIPPLHAFSESIQILPIGLDFLQAFLRKPGEHLKKTENVN